MHRVLFIALCLLLAACGGSPAAPAAQAPAAKDAPAQPTINIQATVDAAVKAAVAAIPTNPPPPTSAPAAAPTAIPPTVVPPTAVPAAPKAEPTEWTIDGMPVKTSNCQIKQICITPDMAMGVIVTEVVLSEKSGNDFIKPAAGNTYVFANVVIGNLGKNPIAYNPLYAKVKDSSGREYQTNIMAGSSMTGGLQNGNLTPGDRVQGIIAFEVPKTSKGFKLTYQPLVFPQPAPVLIDLGQ